jgi:hypothetical protein
MYNEEIFEEFMRRRFPKETDQLYIERWRERFKGGYPENYMDSKSLEAYRQVKKEHKSKILNTVDTGNF